MKEKRKTKKQIPKNIISRSCKTKDRIRWEGDAIKIANKSTRKYGKKFDYYYCAFCGCYHLTTDYEDFGNPYNKEEKDGEKEDGP